MGRRAVSRVVVSLALVGMLLAGGASNTWAVGPGAELAESIDAAVTGPEAYVALTDLAAFPSEGGQAVFEPGTAYEEAFHYTSVNVSAGRLVGLERPNPIAHAAGVFVAPVASEDADAPEQQPSASPSQSSDPAPSSTEAGTETEQSPEVTAPPASSESEAGAAVAAPDPCYTVFDKSCVGYVFEDVIGENPCNQGGTGRTCEDVINDPCGSLLGKSCVDWLFEDVVGENPCNTQGTGQTCEGLINDLVADPCGTLFGMACVDWVMQEVVGENPCNYQGTGRDCDQLINDIAADPCGTLFLRSCDQLLLDWVAFAEQPVDDICDPNDTGRTCQQFALDYGGIGPIPEIEREGELSPADILLQEPALAEHCSAREICGFPQEPKCAAERVRLKWIDKDSGDVMWWVQTRMVWCWEDGQITSENKEHSAGGDPYYISTNDIYIRWHGWAPGTGRVCEGGKCKSTVATGTWCIYQGVPGANGVYGREKWAASVTGKVGGGSSGAYWPMDAVTCPNGPS